MLNDRVWPAMSHAFEKTKGDLADRMLAALDAAQSAGGDIRGNSRPRCSSFAASRAARLPTGSSTYGSTTAKSR